MNPSRRKYLTLAGLGLVGANTPLIAKSIDGVGPNRGIAEKASRGKQTCVNDAVMESGIEDRLSLPNDFGGESCSLIKDSFEGPYFTCAPPTGKNIAMAQTGQPLTVAMRLIDSNCNPIPNGIVDIWSCNAEGYYSGYSNNPNKRPPIVRAMLFGHVKPDRQERFCRGALRTDVDGIAEFDTVYPGFYYEVPIHIHFKVHVDGKNLLTSQANFNETWNDHIMKLAPYNKPRPIERTTAQGRFPSLRVIERDERLLAVLDLKVPD